MKAYHLHIDSQNSEEDHVQFVPTQIMIPTQIMMDHFRDIQMDSQTTDITHFAVVSHYDVTIKALETFRNTAYYL